MIYITQLIYLKEGQENIFNLFEDIAIPIIAKYNGTLLLRIKPDNASYLEANMEKPYEIHFVQFEKESDLHSFMLDEERKKYLHWKEQSIKSVILIKGEKI